MCSENYNREFYDGIWKFSGFLDFKKSPVFEIIKDELRPGRKFLEIGPGLRPRIPIKGSYFVEVSSYASKKLSEKGGLLVSAKDLNDSFFDMVCAFEVLEHVEDDEALLRKIGKSVKKGGMLFISVPTCMDLWSEWDKHFGHLRRYEPEKLEELLKKCGFRIESHAHEILPATFTRGMAASTIIWFLKRFPKAALFLDHYIMRILNRYLRSFRKLKWIRGGIRKAKSNGIYLICRKA